MDTIDTTVQGKTTTSRIPSQIHWKIWLNSLSYSSRCIFETLLRNRIYATGSHQAYQKVAAELSMTSVIGGVGVLDASHWTVSRNYNGLAVYVFHVSLGIISLLHWTSITGWRTSYQRGICARFLSSPYHGVRGTSTLTCHSWFRKFRQYQKYRIFRASKWILVFVSNATRAR